MRFEGLQSSAALRLTALLRPELLSRALRQSLCGSFVIYYGTVWIDLVSSFVHKNVKCGDLQGWLQQQMSLCLPRGLEGVSKTHLWWPLLDGAARSSSCPSRTFLQVP